jgi:hypothetical protein
VPTSPKLAPLAGVIVVVGLAGALVWALTTGRGDAPVPPEADRSSAHQELFLPQKIAFRPVEVDARALDEARARTPSAPPPSDERLAPILTAMTQLGRAERTGAEPHAQRQAQRRFGLQLSEALARDGAPGLQAVEAALWPRFRQALQTIEETCVRDGLTLPDLHDTLEGTLAADLDIVGAFLPLGQALTLLSPTGAVRPADWPIVRIAFRLRLFASLEGSATPQELLAPLETRTFYLWRLHNAPITNQALRLRWAERMPTYVPGYPRQTARTVVLAQSGQLTAARQALLAARQDRPDLAPLLETWLPLLDAPQNP